MIYRKNTGSNGRTWNCGRGRESSFDEDETADKIYCCNVMKESN